MTWFRWLAVAAMACASTSGLAAPSSEPTITAEEWQAYRDHFVSAEGRVVDNGNNNLSHSEGQGYGLLLAVLAQDRPTFEAIWSFTHTELMVRDDGLAAWRWEEDKSPHVTDTNNASDGDILIAYALALAGDVWSEPEKTDAARQIVESLGREVLVEVRGNMLVLPGKDGFSAGQRPDGPVVNPSYWIFEAAPVFARLTPEVPWARVAEDEMKVLALISDNAAGLPADWVSLSSRKPKPAEGFPPEFGYNNIRIPLYLMRAGANAELLAPYIRMVGEDGLLRVDVTTGENKEHLTEPGYRIIGAALNCVLTGEPVPSDLLAFSPTSYFAATLQLLTLDFLRRDAPKCLQGGTAQ